MWSGVTHRGNCHMCTSYLATWSTSVLDPRSTRSWPLRTSIPPFTTLGGTAKDDA